MTDLDAAPWALARGLNRLADAVPGAAEPFPPAEEGSPLDSEENVAGRPTDCVEPNRGIPFVFGTVVATFGSADLTGGGVVTFGNVVVTGSVTGSVVVTLGNVVVTGCDVVTLGNVVVTGSVVVTFGSVVLTGSAVVIGGRAVVMFRSGAVRPATAVLATKPSTSTAMRLAADLMALVLPQMLKK